MSDHWESWRLAIEAAERADRRRRQRDVRLVGWVCALLCAAAILIAVLGR